MHELMFLAQRLVAGKMQLTFFGFPIGVAAFTLASSGKDRFTQHTRGTRAVSSKA
jgi:hypothetical protein